MSSELTRMERERTVRRLQDEALRLAGTVGMRRATVEALAAGAGISKSAFYRFFESKELLFLSVLERVHNDMYGSAERVLAARADLPLFERVALAVREVCRVLDERQLMPFIREEKDLMLSRVPESARREHSVSDEDRIRRLMALSGARFTADADTVCAVVRLLLLTLLFKREVGDRYDEALRLMVNGACGVLVAESQRN